MLAKATKQMNMTVEQWKANGKQLILDFDDWIQNSIGKKY